MVLTSGHSSAVCSDVIPNANVLNTSEDGPVLTTDNQQRFVEHSRIWNGVHQGGYHGQMNASSIGHCFPHQPHYLSNPAGPYGGTSPLPFNAMIFNGSRMVFNGPSLSQTALIRPSLSNLSTSMCSMGPFASFSGRFRHSCPYPTSRIPAQHRFRVNLPELRAISNQSTTTTTTTTTTTVTPTPQPPPPPSYSPPDLSLDNTGNDPNVTKHDNKSFSPVLMRKTLLDSYVVRDAMYWQSRVTLKIDVAFTDHSHIIGKGGRNTQDVMKTTGCHIHFPDANRYQDLDKSNSVSIAGPLDKVESARQALRKLAPLVITFELRSLIGANLNELNEEAIIQEMAAIYSLSIGVRINPPSDVPFVIVKGSEHQRETLKEVVYKLQRYFLNTTSAHCSTSVEILGPQQPFVLGTKNNHLSLISQITGASIHHPYLENPDHASTFFIQGSLEPILNARLHLFGCLPISLSFDVSESTAKRADIRSIEKEFNVTISLKPKKLSESKHTIIIKGAERQISSIYAAKEKFQENSKEIIPTCNDYDFMQEFDDLVLVNSIYPALTSPVPMSPMFPITNSPLLGGISTPLFTNLPTAQFFTFPTFSSESTSGFVSGPSSIMTHDSSLTIVSPSSLGNATASSSVDANDVESRRHNHSHLAFSSTSVSPPSLSSSSSSRFNNSRRSSSSSCSLDVLPTFIQRQDDAAANNSYRTVTTTCNDVSPSTVNRSAPDVMNHSEENGGQTTMDDNQKRENDKTLSHLTTGSNKQGQQAPSSTFEETQPLAAGLLKAAIKLRANDSSNLWKAPGAERSAIKIDYNHQKLLAFKAMQEKVQGARMPNDHWSGFGFSRSSPAGHLRQPLLRTNNSRANVDKETSQEYVNLTSTHSTTTGVIAPNQMPMPSSGICLTGRNGLAYCPASDRGRTLPNLMEELCLSQSFNASSSTINHNAAALTSKFASSSVTPTMSTASTSSSPSSLEKRIRRPILARRQLSTESIKSSDVRDDNGHKLAIYNNELTTDTIGPWVIPNENRTNLVKKNFNATTYFDSGSLSSKIISEDTDDVITLMTNLDLTKYIDTFKEQEIDMKTLLTMNDEDLKELGMNTFGARRKLLVAIGELKERHKLPAVAAASSLSSS